MQLQPSMRNNETCHFCLTLTEQNAEAHVLTRVIQSAMRRCTLKQFCSSDLEQTQCDLARLGDEQVGRRGI